MKESDSLYVDDYNFLFYVLAPETRWIEEDKCMKTVEDLIEQDYQYWTSAVGLTTTK